ncbi:MAG: glycosyl hydrolase [Actinomycetota bacterium]|nr:glycosyl hydrolase [Actinomycetota bacterium]
MKTDAAAWSFRAQTAADAVNTNFGHRLLGLPGTWIGSIRSPASNALLPWSEWHYWWQAHYLDALVDSAWRQHATVLAPAGTSPAVAGPEPGAGRLPEPLQRGEALLRTIRIRNFLRLANSFYDDMAWLALASGRADALARRLRPGGLPCAGRAAAALGAQLADAHTGDLGGGVFWSRKRDFKNTPATAPSALYFARNGQPERAQDLLDWLRSTLFDPGYGFYMDGVHPHPDGAEIERTIYTYNQGPVMGALLELGGGRNLASAAELIHAIGRHLTQDLAPDGDGGGGASRGGPGSVRRLRPLRLEGAGDRGLFTGILVRYLSIAARHHALPEADRGTAAVLVLDTAEALWSGRRSEPFTAFQQEFVGPPAAQPDAAAVELSTQLQAWMAFECAFQLCSESESGRIRLRLIT